MRQYIALTLVFLFIFTSVSCEVKDTQIEKTAEQQTNVNSTTEASTEPQLNDNLPKYDFEGREFKFVTPGDVSWGELNTICADQENGEILNDTMYKRTLEVEERLNVDITERQINYNNIYTEIRTAVMAQDNSFDALYMFIAQAFPLATEGMFYEFTSLPNIDLSMPWWDQNAKKSFTLADRLYYMVGDANMFYNDTTWIIMFNKQLISDFALENPYELVKNGEWTFDKMYEMGIAVSKDLNGDGVITTPDRFGMVTHTPTIDAFIYGAGEMMFEKNKDDIPVITLDNQRFYSVLEKVTMIFNDGGFMFDVSDNGKHKDAGFEAIQPTFEANRALFAGEVLECVRRYRQMETDFGLLPFPKFDKEQVNYSSYSLFATSPVCVPSFVSEENLEMTGAVLEALQSASHDTLVPAYYTTALEGKYLRDEESKEMLDIILGNRFYPMGVMRDYGGIIGELQTMVKANNNAFVSAVEKKIPGIEKDIKFVADSIQKLP